MSGSRRCGACHPRPVDRENPANWAGCLHSVGARGGTMKYGHPYNEMVTKVKIMRPNEPRSTPRRPRLPPDQAARPAVTAPPQHGLTHVPAVTTPRSEEH